MIKILAFAFFLFLAAMPAFAADGVKESVYDRVMRTGTIRCGYTLYSVGLNKDANTGALWGIYKDIVEKTAEKLSLKIEWTEEVGWGQQIEGLNAGRYDLVCSPASITGPRVRAADMTMPLYYSPVWTWVRADDARFDGKGRAALDDAALKISTMDGEQTDALARTYFPKARRLSIPQTSDFSALMLNVTTGKADYTFAEPLSVAEFMESNPHSLKKIEGDSPLLLVANIMLLKEGEPEFKAMMNNILTEMFLSGDIDRAIDHYEKYPDSYVRSKGFN